MNAKIKKHYGPIEPLPNGLPKQMEASGIVTDGNGGSTDLPFDHPFGGDFSMNIAVDKPFLKLDQNVGTGKGNPPGNVHTEIQLGELPHLLSDPQTGTGPVNMTWPEYATAAESFIAPGFTPRAGDSMAIQGDWIIDCGHPDFHSELHEITFMAFGRDHGGAAVVHALYNPYLPSELYNANASLASQVNTPANLTLPTTYPLIPDYLIHAIANVAKTRSTTPVIVPMLVAPSTVPPAPFTVCAPSGAPSGTSGSRLNVSYAFDVRPGVTVSETQDRHQGCATFTVNFGSSYRTVPPRGQFMCPVPWGWLNRNASSYAVGGQINLQQTIQSEATTFFKNASSAMAATLRHRIRVDCFSVLGSPIGPVTNSGQSVTTVTNQLSPLVGWARASRS
ncbi:MAG: hypothetical protein ACYDGY_00785 [Acidimicrobiales bacterium]